MAFKTTKRNGKSWNPKLDENGNEKTTPLPTDYLDGYYIERRENVGQFSSTVFTIQNDEGEEIDVWGDTVLVNEMNKIKEGQYIRIQWHGRKVKKAFDKPGVKLNNNNSFNSWEVFIDEDVPMHTIGMKKDATIKQVTNSHNSPALKNAGQEFAKSIGNDDLPF